MSSPLTSLDSLPIKAISVEMAAYPQTAGIQELSSAMLDFGFALVVDDDGKVAGAMTSLKSLNSAEVAIQLPETLPHAGTVSHARHLFEANPRLNWIPLLDETGCYIGLCASRAEWIKLLESQVTLPRIGGLSTPLGVYLSTGVYTAGAGWPGLLATGILFGLLIFFANLAVQLALFYLPLPQQLGLVTYGTLVFTILLLLIRLSPLSGLHAAEHQTIVVMEKGLPLTADNVKAQSKEHHRCGTNLMVFFFGIELAYWIAISFEPWPLGIAMALVCLVVFFKGWLKIGIVLQRIFTTKPPTPAQIENAIAAGEQLIRRYANKPHAPAGIWQRLWHSGFVVIGIGFYLTLQLLQQIAELLVAQM